VVRIVDSDRHLYESRSLRADYTDPAARHGALGLVDVHLPGNTGSCGDHRKRQRAGEPASFRYDEAFLPLLDGASDFTARLNGKPVAKLSRRPSEYFLDHVRVSSFSHEDPKRLTKTTGDLIHVLQRLPSLGGNRDDARRLPANGQRRA
jgi:hypothetical protein